MAANSNVRKTGWLKRLKTLKRKYFVLRSGSLLDGASGGLEYYDSERKYQQGVACKKCIAIRSCISINKKVDSRNKYAIMLHTRENYFGVICESEQEQQEWMSAICLLWHEEGGGPGFDAVWVVSVKARGLCNPNSALKAGQCRLCLLNKELFFYRLGADSFEISLDLPSVRRCGHNENSHFFLETGRFSSTGEGEIWLQVEDNATAQNIHETVLGAMKLGGSEPVNFRQRTTSAAARSANRSSVAGGSASGVNSSTLPHRTKNPSEGSNNGVEQSAVMRSSSSASRQQRSVRRSFASASPASSHSSIPCSTASQELIRTRTDSISSRDSRGTTSSLSADETDSRHPGLMIGKPRHDSALEEDPYFAIPVRGMSVESNSTSPGRSSQLMDTGYLEMKLPVTSSSRTPETSNYLHMSPDTAWAYNTSSTSTSVSAKSSSSSCNVHDADDAAAYFDMSSSRSTSVNATSGTGKTGGTDSPYMDMASGAAAQPPPSMPKPEKVMCYLSDSSSMESFPKRAYSVGSKPRPLQNTLDRSYMDMSLGSNEWSAAGGGGTAGTSSGEKCSSAPHLPPEDSTGSARRNDSMDDYYRANSDLFMEVEFGSAHNLPTSDSASGSRSGKAGGGGGGGLALPGNGNSQEFRLRTSSAGSKDLRHKALTSSALARENHARMVAGRASMSGGDRLNTIHALIREEDPSMDVGAPHRQRTATIAQDSLRPRTSSFNVSDMRPRSSSSGTRYRDLLSRLAHERSQTHELAMKMLQHSSASSENVSESSTASGATADYLDMDKSSRSTPTSSVENARIGSSPSKASTALNSSGDYIVVDYDSGRGSRGSINNASISTSTTVKGDGAAAAPATAHDGERREDAYVQYSPPPAGGDKAQLAVSGSQQPPTTVSGGSGGGSLQKVISYVGRQLADRPTTPQAESPSGRDYANVDYNSTTTVSNDSIATRKVSKDSTPVTVPATITISSASNSSSASSSGTSSTKAVTGISLPTTVISKPTGSRASSGPTIGFIEPGVNASSASSAYTMMSFGNSSASVPSSADSAATKDQVIDSSKAKPLPVRPTIPLPPKPAAAGQDSQTFPKPVIAADRDATGTKEFLSSIITSKQADASKNADGAPDCPFPLDTLVRPLQLVGTINNDAQSLSVKAQANVSIAAQKPLPKPDATLSNKVKALPVLQPVIRPTENATKPGDSRPPSGAEDGLAPELCYATLALPNQSAGADTSLSNQKSRNSSGNQPVPAVTTTYTQIDFHKSDELKSTATKE